MSDEDNAPSTSELQAQVDNLEHAARVDQLVIAHLEAEGVIDRGKIENLETALVTCRRIGAAIGILMVTAHLTQDGAFDALRTSSQGSHRKLREVAETVIFTGALPTR